MPSTQAAAGWFPDPHGRHEYRYWDGTRWTDHARTGGVTYSDPAASAGSIIGAARGGVAVRTVGAAPRTAPQSAPGGIFARRRAAKQERGQGREAFERLALRAAAGDSAALEGLPAAVVESRRFYTEAEFESRRFSVMQSAIRAVIEDDILTVTEEQHLNRMLDVLGVKVAAHRSMDPELWADLAVARINAGRIPVVSSPNLS